MNVPLPVLVSCVDKVPRPGAMACLDTLGLDIVLCHAMPRYARHSALSCQAYAMDTLAWDNIKGFRSYCVGLRDRSND